MFAYTGDEDAVGAEVAQVEAILLQYQDGAALVPSFRRQLNRARRAHRVAHLTLKLAGARFELYVQKRMRDLAMTNSAAVDDDTFLLLHEAITATSGQIADLEVRLREAEALR